MFRLVLFLFYFLLVRFDFHLFVFYVESETVVDTHVLIGDPNYCKERDDITPPIREKKFVPCNRENAQGDVVAEAILAGEQIEEFSAKEAFCSRAFLFAILSRLEEGFFVSYSPRDTRDRNRDY